MYLGDFRLGDTLDFKFCTTSASTGAPTQLAGSPVISAYPGNSTTQLTAGITLTVDFDTVTGLNNVRVVATSGNGYATATNYALVITTGTVGGTSAVGYCVGHFSIGARSALMPTTAARTLDVTATGAAGIDWANVENPTTALNLSATNIDVDQVVASVSGSVATVTALAANSVNASALAASAVAEIQSGLALSTQVDALEGDTTTLLSRLSAGRATNLDNLDATVSSRLASAGYTAPDNASITAVKAKTDSLAFTVAGQVDSNVQYVNDVEVTGNGQPGTEWGPV